MATGLAWNVDNPLKPIALFDKDAVRDIPFEWDLWLADIGSSYASHTITTSLGLMCSQSSQINGVIKARIKADPMQVLVNKSLYAVTCHIVATNGEEDDQTVWLKIVEK